VTTPYFQMLTWKPKPVKAEVSGYAMSKTVGMVRAPFTAVMISKNVGQRIAEEKISLFTMQGTEVQSSHSLSKLVD